MNITMGRTCNKDGETNSEHIFLTGKPHRNRPI
jgi:hypothetical protein